MEKEIKIIYRPPIFNDRYTSSLYEVRCEGLESGYGNTLEESIRDFDYKNA